MRGRVVDGQAFAGSNCVQRTVGRYEVEWRFTSRHSNRIRFERGGELN